MSETPRRWRVRIAFEPNRFSGEHLSDVYRQLKPVDSRMTTTPAAQPQATKKRNATAGGQS